MEMLRITAKIETRGGTRTERFLTTAEDLEADKQRIRNEAQPGDTVTFKVTSK